MNFKVSTHVFEGPFDLLLRLVMKQKVNIAELSLSELVEQYLHEVKQLENIDLNIASDFILVASALLELKAHAMIPDEIEDGDLAEDIELLSPVQMQEVLIERLIRYKQFQNVRFFLDRQFQQASRQHPRYGALRSEFSHIKPYGTKGVDVDDLAYLTAQCIIRLPRVLLNAQHIAPQRISLQEYVRKFIDKIPVQHKASLEEILGAQASTQELILAFLSLLELLKQDKIDVYQEGICTDIYLQQKVKG